MHSDNQYISTLRFQGSFIFVCVLMYVFVRCLHYQNALAALPLGSLQKEFHEPFHLWTDGSCCISHQSRCMQCTHRYACVRLVNDVAPGQSEMEGVCVYATRCGSHAGSRGKLRFFSSSKHHLDPSALLDRFLIEPTGMLKKRRENVSLYAHVYFYFLRKKRAYKYHYGFVVYHP